MKSIVILLTTICTALGQVKRGDDIQVTLQDGTAVRGKVGIVTDNLIAVETKDGIKPISIRNLAPKNWDSVFGSNNKAVIAAREEAKKKQEEAKREQEQEERKRIDAKEKADQSADAIRKQFEEEEKAIEAARKWRAEQKKKAKPIEEFRQANEAWREAKKETGTRRTFNEIMREIIARQRIATTKNDWLDIAELYLDASEAIDRELEE